MIFVSFLAHTRTRLAGLSLSRGIPKRWKRKKTKGVKLERGFSTGEKGRRPGGRVSFNGAKQCTEIS